MNEHEWIIRQATSDEIERLVDLRMAMFDAMGLLDEENREQVRDDCCAYFEATLPTEVFRVWVACAPDADEGDIKRGASSDEAGTCDGEPIGSIGLVIHSVPPSPFNRAGKEGYIMNLVTLPAWRRRGIARALLSHVVDVLRAEGVPLATLHASDEGRGLYEDLGFWVADSLPEMRLPLV